MRVGTARRGSSPRGETQVSPSPLVAALGAPAVKRISGSKHASGPERREVAGYSPDDPGAPPGRRFWDRDHGSVKKVIPAPRTVPRGGRPRRRPRRRLPLGFFSRPGFPRPADVADAFPRPTPGRISFRGTGDLLAPARPDVASRSNPSPPFVPFDASDAVINLIRGSAVSRARFSHESPFGIAEEGEGETYPPGPGRTGRGGEGAEGEYSGSLSRRLFGKKEIPRKDDSRFSPPQALNAKWCN